MKNLFFPDAYAPSVYDIDYDGLLAGGIVNLLFDVDNTLAAVREALPSAELKFLFASLANMGFRVCLLSNGGARRVKLFASELGASYVAKSKKPAFKGLRLALSMLDAERGDTAIIGDQLFTDVLCGKRARIHAILVKPISADEQWYIKLKRMLETPLLAAYMRKR